MEQRTIRLNFDLSFVYGPRTWRAPLVAAMLLAAVGDLNSESVTLSTYYPAPSGVYTNMITTGHTYMARDPLTVWPFESRVGIGTISPTQKLTVVGNANVTGFIGAGLPLATAPTQAVDVRGSVRVNRSGCNPSTTPFGTCGGGFYMTWAPGVYVEGSWATGPSVMTTPGPPGFSGGVTLRTPTYYCCPD